MDSPGNILILGNCAALCFAERRGDLSGGARYGCLALLVEEKQKGSGGHNGNDGDDDKELNKSESGARAR
jgi:hypothetical protein